MMCTNMTTILSHKEGLGPSMLDVKYEGLGGTGLVTIPLIMAPNLSECNVSHCGIAPWFQGVCCSDQLHCCAFGYKCDMGHKICVYGDDMIPWLPVNAKTSQVL